MIVITKIDNDFVIHYPDSPTIGYFILDVFRSPLPMRANGNSFFDELSSRGYNIKTINFSIQKKGKVKK